MMCGFDAECVAIVANVRFFLRFFLIIATIVTHLHQNHTPFFTVWSVSRASSFGSSGFYFLAWTLKGSFLSGYDSSHSLWLNKAKLPSEQQKAVTTQLLYHNLVNDYSIFKWDRTYGSHLKALNETNPMIPISSYPHTTHTLTGAYLSLSQWRGYVPLGNRRSIWPQSISVVMGTNCGRQHSPLYLIMLKPGEL